MLIDWFTVIAQIINFLILVWLLKRFLFKPILKAIDEREKKIKNELQEAAIKVEEAETARKIFKKKKKDFEAKRQSLLNTATEKANQQRKKWLDEARQEAAALQSRLERSIREKQQQLHREITERTQQEVMAISRQVLTDLASAKLEDQIVSLFVRRLQETEGEERDHLIEVLDGASGTVQIWSAFELSGKQQNDIEKAILEIATEPIRCRFDVASDKISGIELNVHGYKIAWSVADYLNSLENHLAELLDQEPEMQPR